MAAVNVTAVPATAAAAAVAPAVTAGAGVVVEAPPAPVTAEGLAPAVQASWWPAPKLSSSRVTVTTSPTLLVPGGHVRSVLVTNVGSAAVDLGSLAVTTGAGFPLEAGGIFAADFVDTAPLYAVAASGTVVLAVMVVLA